METNILIRSKLVFLLPAIGLLLYLGLTASAATADAGPTSKDQASKPTPEDASCNVTVIIASPNVAPNPNTLTDVEVISPNDVWVVGYSGQLYPGYGPETSTNMLILHWDGTTWSVSPTPSFGSTNALRSISAVSSTDLWAVGRASDGTLTMHWDGTQWNRVASPNACSVTSCSQLYGVEAVSANDVWAVGGGKQTLTMHWDGTQWSIIPSPNYVPGVSDFEQNVLYDVEAISANDVWFVGFGGARYDPDVYSDSTYILHWNGSQLNRAQASGYIYGVVRRLAGISILSAEDIWVVGTISNVEGSSSQTLIMHWNGSAWTTIPSPNSGQKAVLNSIQALSPTNVWAAGSTDGQSLTMHWDGSAWNTVPGSPGNTLAAIDGLSETTLWTVGSSGEETLTLNWNGVQWAEQDSPNYQSGYNTLRAVEVLAPNNIWAVGYSAPFRSDYSSLGAKTMVQHWDGAQWTVVSSPNVANTLGNFLLDVSAVAPDDIWAVGETRQNGPSRNPITMHWDGTEWTIIPSGDFLSVAAVSMISTDDVWAVGYTPSTLEGDQSHARLLHWNGQQWVRDNTLIEPLWYETSLLVGIAALASDDVWGVGFYRSSSSQPFVTYIVHWNGTQWSRVPSPNVSADNNRLRAVTSISANDVWAVGYAGLPGEAQNFALHWDGVQWSVVPTPSVGESSYLYGLDASSANEVWAVGSFFSAGIPHTLVERWNGAQWEVVSTPDLSARNNLFNAVASISPGQAWAVGDYGFQDAQLTLVESIDVNLFSDVQPDNAFYPYIRCLTNQGVISGYSDCTFRPNNDLTRGQLSKIVSNSANFDEDPGPQVFEDVPPGSTFYDWANRLANRGHISGYPCGGEGEPCGLDNKPYFRPNATATRGQISKIVSNAAGYNDTSPNQTFEDVPPSNPFYLWIERLASRGIMSGYPCGGEGEPCGLDSKPYFRWGNNATRGQTSKIVANSFFPACQAR
jgi:hypothetical protein